MIDNLPYYTTDSTSIKNVYSSNSLIFVSNEERANKQTGELFYVHRRKYLNLNLTFHLNNGMSLVKLIVRGSIHKLFNKGIHNANNYSFNDFSATLREFTNDFRVDLTKCVLLPFEYGLNLNLNEFSNYSTLDLVLNTLCEQRKIFTENVGGCITSRISGSVNSEMRMKIYDKSVESKNKCENTLRIEIQQKKTRDLKKNGIYYVSDLLKLKNQIYLFEKFMKYVNQLVIFDYTMQIPKRSKYHLISMELKDQNYWRKLIMSCKNGDSYNTKYNDKISLLCFLSNKYGSNLKNVLLERAERQYKSNLDLCNFTSYKLIKIPKNARQFRPKHALLYNMCKTCAPFNNFNIVGGQNNLGS